MRAGVGEQMRAIIACTPKIGRLGNGLQMWEAGNEQTGEEIRASQKQVGNNETNEAKFGTPVSDCADYLLGADISETDKIAPRRLYPSIYFYETFLLVHLAE